MLPPVQTVRLTFLPPARLDTQARDEIWRFFSRFSTRERAVFDARLSASLEVFVGRLPDGRLVAFGVVDLLVARWRCRPHGLIHTNWAVIDPALRGQNLIQRAGFRSFVKYRLRHPSMRLYWLFGASTYKSYLLLARNFRDYWPRRGHAWPERERALVHDVMARAGGPGWDPSAGVIRRQGVSRYHEGVVDDDPAALADPDVAFYAAANPGQAEGDTLLCICPLDLPNWLAIARRVVSRRRARRPAVATVG